MQLSPQPRLPEPPATNSQAPLRVAPGGRYFETADGEPFLMIGFNDAMTWPGLCGLYRRRDVDSVRRYLENVAAHGVNTLRLMLEYVHVDGRYFERPAGRFNPIMVRFWDDLFALCDELGLRVLLAPWDNFWMTRRWHRHPYNHINGGPAREKNAFFGDEETIAMIEARLRFVATRWGSALGAWDLFNEIFGNWGGTPEHQAQVLSRWSRAIREAEMEKWGWTRPQTVSIFGPNPDGAPGGGYHRLIFAHPEMDFATTHIYHPEFIDNPRETVSPALSLAHWTRYGLEHTPAHRPFTDTEHGPIALFNNERKYLPEDFDDEYERHMMWAHLASGGAGAGMRWPGRHPHILTPGMLRALKSLSDFLPCLDWRHFEPRHCLLDVEVGAPSGEPSEPSEPSVHICASRDERQAIVWLVRDNGGQHGMLPERAPLERVPIVIRGLEPGDYTLSLWHTRAGRLIESRTVRSDNERELRFEASIENDLAIAVRPVAST